MDGFLSIYIVFVGIVSLKMSIMFKYAYYMCSLMTPNMQNLILELWFRFSFLSFSWYYLSICAENYDIYLFIHDFSWAATFCVCYSICCLPNNTSSYSIFLTFCNVFNLYSTIFLTFCHYCQIISDQFVKSDEGVTDFYLFFMSKIPSCSPSGYNERNWLINTIIHLHIF